MSNLTIQYSSGIILLSVLLSYIGSIFGISLAEQYRQNTIHDRELKELDQLTQKNQDHSISASGHASDIESKEANDNEIPVTKRSFFFNSSSKGWIMLVSKIYF
jgi:hypothetical protein